LKKSETLQQSSTAQTTGKGIKKYPKLVRITTGGSSKQEYQNKINKFYIDMKKFKNGLLCVKYTSNDNIHPKLRTTIMSKELKNILENYFNEKKVDKSILNKLSKDDKLIINKLGKLLDINDFMDDTIEDEFNEKFNTLIGIYNAGNDNPDIIKQLKKLILNAIHQGIMTQKEGYKYIIELTI
jgi:hypothetical protein